MADLLRKYRGPVVIMVGQGWLKMYLKFDEIVPSVFILCKKMITTNEKACLMPRSCCFVPLAAAIAPKSLRGVYYALRGGNHVIHYRQSHWKKLVRGAVNHHRGPGETFLQKHILEMIFHQRIKAQSMT